MAVPGVAVVLAAEVPHAVVRMGVAVPMVVGVPRAGIPPVVGVAVVPAVALVEVLPVVVAVVLPVVVPPVADAGPTTVARHVSTGDPDRYHPCPIGPRRPERPVARFR